MKIKTSLFKSMKRKWCRSCKTRRAHVQKWYADLKGTCVLWNGYCGCAVISGKSEEEAKREVPCHGGYTQAWTCGRCHTPNRLAGEWTLIGTKLRGILS